MTAHLTIDQHASIMAAIINHMRPGGADLISIADANQESWYASMNLGISSQIESQKTVKDRIKRAFEVMPAGYLQEIESSIRSVLRDGNNNERI